MFAAAFAAGAAWEARAPRAAAPYLAGGALMVPVGRLVMVRTFKKDELVRVHKDASFLELANQATGGSPIPFHPGAVRYYKEKGITVR